MNDLQQNITNVPERKDVFRLPEAGKKSDPDNLQPFLAIKPPETSQNTPPVLAFQRKREIDIPWHTIIGSATTAGTTSTGAIREYFERSWNLNAEDLADFVKDPAPQIQTIPRDTGATDQRGKPMYRTNLKDPQKPTNEAVSAGIVL